MLGTLDRSSRFLRFWEDVMMNGPPLEDIVVPQPPITLSTNGYIIITDVFQGAAKIPNVGDIAEYKQTSNKQAGRLSGYFAVFKAKSRLTLERHLGVVDSTSGWQETSCKKTELSGETSISDVISALQAWSRAVEAITESRHKVRALSRELHDQYEDAKNIAELNAEDF